MLMYDENYDLFEQSLFALRDTSATHNYCFGTDEIDEARGTWGYFHFGVPDLEKARAKLIRETTKVFE